MKKINKTMGVTIVVITHEMKVIDSICDRVAVLDNSTVAEMGDVREIFSNPKSDIAKKLVLPERKTVDEVSEGKGIRIVFNGENSGKPVIANLIFECGTAVNITYADTKELDGKAYGQMIIRVPDESTDRVKAYLEKNGMEFSEVE